VLWRYPLMTAQVVAGIHWQALRLWLKRTPVHDHPAKLERPRMNSVVRTTPDGAFDALDRFLRGRLLRQLDALRGGQVALVDALGSTLVGEAGHGPAIRLAGPRCRLLSRAGARVAWVRRSLHGRHWDCATWSRWCASGAQPRPAGRHGRRAGAPRRLALMRCGTALRRNTRDGSAPQHRRALRPRQRLLPAVPRPMT
jgi:hypothetical protein